MVKYKELFNNMLTVYNKAYSLHRNTGIWPLKAHWVKGCLMSGSQDERSVKEKINICLYHFIIF